MIVCVISLTDCKKEEAAAPYSPPATTVTPPTAYFSYSPNSSLVAPVTVNFTNGSKSADSYVWTYDGTGRTLTTADIALVFDQAGTYTVSLKATGKGGSDTYSKSITVAAPPTNTTKPIADFTYSPSANLTVPATVVFANTSKNADSYTWDFGDGTTSATASPTKSFTKAGDFVVKLTATDAKKQTDQKSVTISIKAATVTPTADYTWSASNLKVTFTNTSKNANSYQWNFGDGTATTTSTNPVHDFAKAGTYNVNLKASDGKSEAQTTKLVTVSAPVTASCDWEAWNKLVKITRFEFDQKGSYCGSSKGISYLEVQNLSGISLSIDFCFKSTNGTWDYCAFQDTGAGQLMKTNQCGKQVEVKVWARPYGYSSTCPFPKP